VVSVYSNNLDRIVTSLLETLIGSGSVEHFTNLLSQMKSFEQRKYLTATVVFVVKECFPTEIVSKDDAPIASSSTVSSTGALLHALTKNNDVLKEHLVLSLTRSNIPALDESLSARRSVLAALAKDEGQLDHTPIAV
jgi:telomere length regulation protein